MASMTDTNFGTETLHGIEVAELHSLDQLLLPINRQIFTWWTSIPSGYPKRSDFRIDEHLRIASNLFLVRRIESKKYKYTICGENISSITGRQSHGVTFEPKPKEYIGFDNFNQLIDHYKMITETKKPYYCIGNASLLGVRNSGFESIDCPLFDDEGNVTHIMGSLQLEE